MTTIYQKTTFTVASILLLSFACAIFTPGVLAENSTSSGVVDGLGENAGEEKVAPKKHWSWRVQRPAKAKANDAGDENGTGSAGSTTSKTNASGSASSSSSESDSNSSSAGSSGFRRLDSNSSGSGINGSTSGTTRSRSGGSHANVLPSDSPSSTSESHLNKSSESDSAGFRSAGSGLEIKAVPESAQIVILPILVAGHKCTISVTDANGKAIEGAGVYLDEELFSSDRKGLVTFTVPDAQSFALSLVGAEHKRIIKHRFVRSTDKVFAENDKLADIAASLLKIESTASSAPIIVYAPAVLSPGKTFVVIGRNLSEKIADDYVDIDGSSASILSASQDGVLAIAPAKLSLGPLREIFMTVNGQASNAAEIDIATTFFTHVKTESDDVSPEKGRIGMNGTNVPCLLRLRNLDQENVSLWSPTQEPLGKDNIMLSPGGEQNYLNIDIRLLEPSAEPTVEISLEQELAASGKFGQTQPQLLSALCRAEIMRLERRRISANFRLDELSKKEPDASATPAEIEKVSSEKKALSTRLRRVSIMLAARKAIFESLGSTDAQYRQALDDAAGGALFSLDQSIKPIQIISDGGVSSGSSTGKVNGKKARQLRMLEPAIRLLPPMNDEQIAIMNSRKAFNQPEYTPTQSRETGSGNSNEPSLRPSMPEPEPEVSEGNRATTPSNANDKTVPKKVEKSSAAKAKPPAAKAPIKTENKSASKNKKSLHGKKHNDHDDEGIPATKHGKHGKHGSAHSRESAPAEPVSHSRRRHGKKSQSEPVKTSTRKHRRHHSN